MIFAEIEVIGKPAPNPAPDNDVHFHVNMPGSGRSFPLKNKGTLRAIDRTNLCQYLLFSQNLSPVSTVNKGLRMSCGGSHILHDN